VDMELDHPDQDSALDPNIIQYNEVIPASMLDL